MPTKDHGFFNARDSNYMFEYMYAMCKTTICDKCEFGSGDWVTTEEGFNYRCEMPAFKEKMKNRNR